MTEGHDRLFETKHIVLDLRRLVLQGGLMKILSQASKFGMRVAGLVVMARLVTPGDYGVFAMVATLTGLLMLLRDAGLHSATVQKKTISHEDISALFWVNAAVGVSLACVTAVLAPVMARFYGDPRITAPVAMLGLSFIFSGFSTQHTALLSRQLRFQTLETIGVASQFAGGVAMLGSAYFGAGYWAMVLNVLTMRVVEAFLVLAASRWRPSRPRRAAGAGGVGAMLRFGRDMSGFNVVNYLYHNLDNILIGRYCSAVDLGLYVKAYGLLRLPIMQIQDPMSTVVVPALSRLQDDDVRYRSYFLKATTAVVIVSMPLVALTAISSREILLLLLGERWLGAVPIFQALIPAAFLGTTDMIAGWVFLSLGRTDLLLRLGTVKLLVVAAAFVCGLPGGPVGVAAAYSVAYCLLSLPTMAFALRHSPVSLGDVLRAVWRPFATSIASAFLVVRLMTLFPAPHAVIALLALKGALYVGLYGASWALIPGGLSAIRALAAPALETIRNLLGKTPALSA